MGWLRGAEVPRISNDATASGQESAGPHAVMEGHFEPASFLPSQGAGGNLRAEPTKGPGNPPFRQLRGVCALSLRCLR